MKNLFIQQYMNDLYPFKFKYKDIKYLIYPRLKSSFKKNIYQQRLIDDNSPAILPESSYFHHKTYKKRAFKCPLLPNYEKVLLN
jgi:hypothetical protein